MVYPGSYLDCFDRSGSGLSPLLSFSVVDTFDNSRVTSDHFALLTSGTTVAEANILR